MYARKIKISEIKGYVQLLNAYYVKYGNPMRLNYKREVYKRIFYSLLGLLSPKIKHMSTIYSFLENKDVIGYLEYTNHKIGLLNGYLKTGYVNSNQIHIYSKFKGSGLSLKMNSKYHEILPTGTRMYALINTENVVSQHMTETVGYRKYKTLEFYELTPEKLIERSSYSNRESNSLTFRKYQRRDFTNLFDLYLRSTPEEIRKIEGFTQDIFYEKKMDELIDHFTQKLIGCKEYKYSIWDHEKLIGFLAFKLLDEFMEMRLFTDHSINDDAKDSIAGFILKYCSMNPKRVQIYINSYQTGDIEILKSIGFINIRSYYEYCRINS